MKKLPIGIQTFSDLITGDYLYIDKTESIHRLIATGGRYYFLSRPRRFGKSLMVSTLKELFSGNKELFKGLWIYDKIEWKSYPVIKIDFLGLNYGSKN
ncbi:MAG: AAA family ATPase [bacterium]|nr:AAA family ATPase [bacterium]